ncbi:CD109 antigen-like isoform X2 [Ostrea edulis]|uniref:CD109 antigen-like isoform X2 n=1 Tax=Ostrea edulis TaxID=37623 RepID=UPI002094EA0A|nr:CD109 antigen-like isoform X2 [Ostrea edulis]
MEGLKVSLVVLLSVISCSLAKNSYVVMFPKTIRPNLDTQVNVQLLDASRAAGTTVVVSLVDKNNKTIVSEMGTTDPANPTRLSIPLKMPASLTVGEEYAIMVQGEGGTNFSNYTKVQFNPKYSSIMIQTDKAIYKPGQTINFRVFGMYPDLSIVNDNIDVEIYDPLGNKIAQWKNKVPDNGVYTDSLVMSDHPVLGEWKIKAVQGNEAYTKTVTVDEYVLPKFDVNLELPPYGLSNRNLTGIKVVSKYTFGKPVKGTVDIRLRPPYLSRSPWSIENRKKQGLLDEISHSAPINGEYKFDVEISKLKSLDKWLDYSEILFEVNVTEALTGLRQNASGTVRFYPHENKVEFLESLPKTFKPGLKYTVLGRVMRQDDSPISLPTASRVKLTVTHTLPLPSTTTSTTTTTTPPPPPEAGVGPGLIGIEEPFIVNRRRPMWQPTTKDEKMEPVFLDVDVDGIFKYEMTIPPNVKRASVDAQYEKSSSYLGLNPSKSPSESYMQVSLMNPDVKPTTGSVSSFEIKTTEPTPKVYYQVVSKGQVVHTGDIDMQSSKVKTFTLPITTDMAPKARLIVHYVRDDGEIVTDALTFNIKGTFKNKVDIDFDVKEARPGKEVVVSVKADPDSTVHLLAVDKSVLILRSDNDIKESRINDELNSYDNEHFGGGWGPFARSSWWPMPSGGEDADDVFRNNGIVVLTDALVYNYEEPWLQPMPMLRRMGGPVMAMAAQPMAFADNSVGMAAGSGPPSSKSPPRVRKLFPETWLWSNSSTGPDGVTSLSIPVPDTITTWVATAFAVNPNSGLGLTPSPANVKVFQPFFVSLTMPYSVTRGELVVLQANVFNYLNHDVRVLVIIDKNEGFKNLVTYIQDNQVKKGRFSARVGRTFNMTAGEIYPVYFPITPTETGDLKINITVISTGPGDAVIRYLKVEPEGVEKEFNNPVLINTGNTGTFSEDVQLSFPPNTVAGSKRIRASVIGDVMGPSISGLDSLLKMPYGCGEQNMLNFAPNIFVQKYLTITNNLTPDLEKKAKEYMIKGYQRELTYSHDDGSYSAFGKSDKSGTTWLTAFVVKSFSEAYDFITIDEEVVKKAVTWLVSQQNNNGTVREPGRVLHKEMQGSSASGERALTAFVLIALKEAGAIPGVSELTGRAIRKARTYLEEDIHLLEDMYELALVAYALQITESPRVGEVINKLNAKATVKDGLKFWSKPATGIQWKGWAPPKDQSKAVDIETTAYALLNLGVNKDLEGGLPVLKWITSQRNPEGGFSSTQDTIIALQALSEFASMVFSPTFNMRVRLTSKTPGVPYQHEFTVNQNNALVLQTVDIPLEIDRLGVTAEGSGIALAEISTYFNTDEEIEVQSFDVNVTLADETTKGFTVKVCGRWLKKGNSGMAMMDIGVPSGMTPDKDSLDTSKAPMYKRIESGYRKISLYFDEFDGQAQCASIYMANTDKVAEKQPSVIRLYDYYEPKNQATTFYTSKVLADSGVCDVCGTECFCAAKP